MLRTPDHVNAYTEAGEYKLQRSGDTWSGGGCEIAAAIKNGEMPVVLRAPDAAVKHVRLRWKADAPAGVRILNDQWERSYADLGWRCIEPSRALPWYFMMYDGKTTSGYGVKTGPNAFCFWQVDSDGFSLWLDVRCGGQGVLLGQKELTTARVIAREGLEDESAFEALRAFCSMMCEKPRLPKEPVYGSNNWYYSMGEITHESVIKDINLMAEVAPDGENRPFVVIDSGWQLGQGSCAGGPWAANRFFPDMPGLARKMRDMKMRPGIWIRPLFVQERVPQNWLLPEKRFSKHPLWEPILDPTVPDVLEEVKSYVRTVVDNYGYELVKHDFSTWDLLGRWGHQMGGQITSGGWTFSDRTITTAEAILGLYRAIREAAGEAYVIGCNTMTHLSAGLFELQRIGDDTSAFNWERNRRMGVNTLAFRAAHHNTFYAADADCVGIVGDKLPWELNRQWLDLVACSGTPLFVSVDPENVNAEQLKAVRRALEINSKPLPLGEPLDWFDTLCPSRWKLNGEEKEYDWYGEYGANPFFADFVSE